MAMSEEDKAAALGTETADKIRSDFLAAMEATPLADAARKIFGLVGAGDAETAMKSATEAGLKALEDGMAKVDLLEMRDGAPIGKSIRKALDSFDPADENAKRLKETLQGRLDLELHRAAVEGDVTKFDAALAAGADYLSKHTSGKTAYELAKDASKDEIAKTLKAMAESDLATLVAEGKHDRLETALAHGGISVLGDKGMEALLLAVRGDEDKKIAPDDTSTDMLRKAVHSEAKDDFFKAIAAGDGDAVTKIIKDFPDAVLFRKDERSGIDALLSGKGGRTGFEIAADMGRTDIARMLADAATTRLNDPYIIKDPEKVEALLVHASASSDSLAGRSARDAALAAGNREVAALLEVKEIEKPDGTKVKEAVTSSAAVTQKFLENLKKGDDGAAYFEAEHVNALTTDTDGRTAYELARLKRDEFSGTNPDKARMFGAIAEKLADQATQRLPYLVGDADKLDMALNRSGARVGSDEFKEAKRLAKDPDSINHLADAEAEKAKYDLFKANTRKEVEEALEKNPESLLQLNSTGKTAWEMAKNAEVKAALADAATARLGDYELDPVRLELALKQGGADATSPVGRNALDDINKKLADPTSTVSTGDDLKKAYESSKILLEDAIADKATERLQNFNFGVVKDDEERRKIIDGAIKDGADFLQAYQAREVDLAATAAKTGAAKEPNPLKDYMDHYQDKILDKILEDDNVKMLRDLKKAGIDTTHLENRAKELDEKAENINTFLVGERMSQGIQDEVAKRPSYDAAGRTDTGTSPAGYKQRLEWQAAAGNTKLLQSSIGDTGILMAPPGTSRVDIDYTNGKVRFERGQDIKIAKDDNPDIVMDLNTLAPSGKLRIDLSRTGNVRTPEITFSGDPKEGSPRIALDGRINVKSSTASSNRVLNAKNADGELYVVTNDEHTAKSLSQAAERSNMYRAVEDAKQEGGAAAMLAAMKQRAIVDSTPYRRLPGKNGRAVRGDISWQAFKNYGRHLISDAGAKARETATLAALNNTDIRDQNADERFVDNKKSSLAAGHRKSEFMDAAMEFSKILGSVAKNEIPVGDLKGTAAAAGKGSPSVPIDPARAGPVPHV